MVDNPTLTNTLPTSVTDRYSIKKMIGNGGMGHVYLAEDVELKRNVAIKTIRPELIENIEVNKRIERECRFHAAIGVHPNIVGLYDKIVVENQIFLILEYVKGETLTELIASAKQKGGELSLTKVVEIVCQFLAALSTIHEHGILHRDIKPSNILIEGICSNNPVAKLMDFGIAREKIEDAESTKLTQLELGNPGTPAYMSPERIDSAAYGEISTATDLYAVGVILYELFHLEPPFKGTMTEIFSGHLAREPDFSNISVVPGPIRTVLHKALEKETTNRYQDAKVFASDLRAASLSLSEETILANLYDPSTLNETILNANYISPTRRLTKRKTPYVISLIVLVLLISTFTIVDLKTKDNNVVSESTVVELPPVEVKPANVNAPQKQVVIPPGDKQTDVADVPLTTPQELETPISTMDSIGSKQSTAANIQDVNQVTPDIPDSKEESVPVESQNNVTSVQQKIPSNNTLFSFQKSNAAFDAFQQALAEKKKSSKEKQIYKVIISQDPQVTNLDVGTPLKLSREHTKRSFSVPAPQMESSKRPQSVRKRIGKSPIIIIPTT